MAPPTPQNRWQWTPIRAMPQPPRHGGTAPAGDIPELMQHLCYIRRQGASVAEAEQAWVDGMKLVDLRGAQFPRPGPVVNDLLGVFSGEWRVYIGRPAASLTNTFALAFNTRTGAIAVGVYPKDFGPHPTQSGQQALFNFRILYP